MLKPIRLACVVVAGLALASCSEPSDEDTAPVIQVPIAGQAAPKPDRSTLAFYDSDAFDSSLAQALSSGTKDVHVTFAGTTNVNAMPPRINAWLAEVKKSNGDVVAKDPADPNGSRGLLGLGMIADIVDLVTWYQQRKEREAQLATANSYNALVMYNAQTGSLRELVFEQRPPAPPKP